MALQTLKLRGLGTKGVVSDLAPFDTNVDSWSDAKNIRFNNGRAEKIRGHIPVFYNNRESSLEFESKKQIPMHLILMPQSDDEWLYCTENAIWKTNGWTHTNMNPTDATVNIDVPLEAPWSSTTISNSVIVSSQQLSKPLGLASGENNFKELPKWGKWSVNTMRSFKNFVMAIGGGDTYPQRVRWSNLVPPNALPADWGWEVTDAGDGNFIDGSAGGYNDLSFAQGKLVDGRPLRDQFILYTDREVISCTYVGGNDIFRFGALFDEGGAINPDCIAEFDNKHFVVSANDIYVHNGSTKESVIDNKVREKLLDLLAENSISSVKVVPYLTENEIWVIYAGNDAVSLTDDSDVKEATQAAIYNYKFGTWSFIDLPRTLDIKLGPVPIYDESEQKVQTWENLPDNYLWEDAIELWNLAGGGSSQNFKGQSLICASSDGGFYVLDRGDYFSKLGEKDTTTNIYKIIREDIISNLNKDYIDLDEVTDTIDYKTILAIWPQTTGTGELYVQVGGSAVPGGDIQWGDAVRYVCTKDRKVDLRQNWRYLCINIQGRGVGDWKLSGFDAVVRIGGRR